MSSISCTFTTCPWLVNTPDDNSDGTPVGPPFKTGHGPRRRGFDSFPFPGNANVGSSLDSHALSRVYGCGESFMMTFIRIGLSPHLRLAQNC